MDPSYLSITQIHSLYKNGELNPTELVKYYCSRIKKLNPKLNAVLDWSEEKAIEQAEKLIFSVGTGRDLSLQINDKKLWGIPVLVKDNFVTRDFKTTASSKILDGYESPFDATVVEKLKAAGAIILGKTNLDAFAHGSSTETSDYGTTLNPWDTNKLPGGSSGGSAAAVAADMCVLAIGSETAGSVRQPASWCGTVGLKPTYGRVSRWGEILMASSTDCPGILARNVEDAGKVLKAIEGYDERDAQSIDDDQSRDKSRLVPTNKNIKDVVIGICDDYFMKDAEIEVNEKVKEAIEKFESLGAKVKKIKLMPPRYSIAVYTILQRSEVSSNLARFDGIRYGGKRDIFNAENTRRIILGTYTLSAGHIDAYYLKAVKVRTLIINDFKKAFQDVDLIIAPTSPSTALPVGSSKNHPMFGEIADVLVESSSIAQLPGINLTCGFDKKNMPIGMQIIGSWRKEDLIMQVAKIYEDATKWHEQHPNI